MKLKDKIRILRKVRGYSQQDLGDRLSKETFGISRQSVSDWENGNSEPKLDNIRELAKVLNVSFDALLDDSIDLDDSETLMRVLNNAPKDENRPYHGSIDVYRSHALPLILLAFILFAFLFHIINVGRSINMSVADVENAPMTIFDQIIAVKLITKSNDDNINKLYNYVLYVVTCFPFILINLILLVKTPSKYKVATVTSDGVYLIKRNLYISNKDINEVRKSKVSFKWYGSLTIRTKDNKKKIVPFIFKPQSISKFTDKIF